MGVFIITAALVILLSAFNGIETMIEKLYSDFEPDITITANKRKTFDESEINWVALKNCIGVNSFSKGIEEVVVLKHDEKWVNATVMGVESNFLRAINIKNHLVAGKLLFNEKNSEAYGIIGINLIQKLNVGNGFQSGHKRILIYAPKRNVKIRFGKSPFYNDQILLSAVMNYNLEINQEKILWPLKNVRKLLNYSSELSHIYIDVNKKYSNEEIKGLVKKIVGGRFSVKTNYEKNEIIFKTSKSERIIIIFIMIFIFILASFNLIASLTMLYIEKKSNLKTFQSFGMTKQDIFKIFFYEGILISGIGVISGMIFGYVICILQLKFSVLIIPGANIPFPVKIAIKDFFLVLVSVSILSISFSYFTSRFLLNSKDE